MELQDLTPASVLAVPIPDLRAAGLSTRKVMPFSFRLEALKSRFMTFAVGSSELLNHALN